MALQLSSTAACSIAVVTMCFPFRFPSSAAPRTAQLSPSVPQERKVTSLLWQPRAAARSSRQPFRAAAACWPRPWREEGLPHPRVMASRAAWDASGRTGVVAALSK